jgi:hypothetical protein
MVLKDKAPQLLNADWTDSLEFSTAAPDGKLAIQQRLQHLIDLAVAIGRKEGRLGRKITGKVEPGYSGGMQDVQHVK